MSSIPALLFLMPNVPPPKKLRGRLTNWKETLRRGEIRGRISSVAGILGFVFHYSFVWSSIGSGNGGRLLSKEARPCLRRCPARWMGQICTRVVFLHGAFSGLDTVSKRMKNEIVQRLTDHSRSVGSSLPPRKSKLDLAQILWLRSGLGPSKYD